MIIVTLISAIFIWYLFSFVQNQIHESTNIEKTYDEFITMLENEKLKKVVVRGEKITFVPKEQTNSYDVTYYTGNLYDENLPNQLKEAHDKYGLVYEREIVDNRSTIFETIISMLLPFILYGIMWFVFRAVSKNSGGVMGVGKSNAKVYVENLLVLHLRMLQAKRRPRNLLRRL